MGRGGLSKAKTHERGANSRTQVLNSPIRVKFDGSVAFRHTRQMLIPERPGIYLIHDLRGVLYVGRTENLYRRFGQHYWQSDNELLDRAMRRTFGQLTFTWTILQDPIRRIQLEAALIAWLRPPCNRQIG